MGLLVSIPIALCVPRITVLNLHIARLHDTLRDNLTTHERYNTSMTLTDLMMQRYDLLQPDENPT